MTIQPPGSFRQAGTVTHYFKQEEGVEYRKEIDGLRALAILGVLFFHVGLFPLHGGYLGVDVFFVISGFLISSLLFAEAETTGTISLSDFYQRRARRILPALFTVLVVTFIPISLLISSTPAFSVYARSIPWAAVFVANIFFFFNSGYFSVEALQSPLLHTWTLGVEEQFYIIIPFVILALAARKKARAETNILALLLLWVASFIFCRYGKRWVDSNFVFYMLPTRMWELLTGVIATLVAKRFKPESRVGSKICDAVSLTSIAAIVIAFAAYRQSTNFAEKSLVVVLATALILVFSQGGRAAKAILGAGPVRFLGKISYSMYLWHWPLATIAFFLSIKYDIPNQAPLQAAVLVATLSLSMLSWKFVEQPLRKTQSWRELARPISPFVAALAVVCVVAHVEAADTRKPYILDNDQLATQMSLEQLKAGEAIHLGTPGAPEQFILLGDSHARCISRAFDILARERGQSGLAATYSNVLPLAEFWNADIDNGNRIAQAWLDLVEQKGIKNVFIACNWSALSVGKFYRNGRQLPKDEVIPAFLEDFSATLDRLLAHGCDIWLLEQVPSWKRDPALSVNLRNDYNEVPDRGLRGNLFQRLAQVRDGKHVHVIDPWELFVTGGELWPAEGNRLLYFDSNHLSQDGARRLTRGLSPFFESFTSTAAHR